MRGKALAAVLLAACTQEDPQLLFISGMLAPPTPSASTCLFRADPKGPFLDLGVVDTTLASRYTAVLLIGNESSGHFGDDRLHLDETSIEHASVVDFESDGTTELDRFTDDVGGLVLPASNGSPGFGSVAVQLVSPRALQAVVGQRILARVRVDGRFVDGTRATSGDVVIPIDVCSGCLVRCPSTGACTVGQDQTVCE